MSIQERLALRICPLCRGTGDSDRLTLICRACGGTGHLVKNPYQVLRKCEWIPELLQGILRLAEADQGNVQLFDSSQWVLRIVAQQGFEREFLRHFAIVRADGCACGQAMKTGARVVVPDVSSHPIFDGSESQGVMLRAKARAVQSTPLIASTGSFVGMISTHYERRRRFPAPMWKQLDRTVKEFMAKVA